MFYHFFSLNHFDTLRFSHVIFCAYIYGQVAFVRFMLHMLMLHCKLLEGKDYVFILLVFSSILKMMIEKTVAIQ